MPNGPEIGGNKDDECKWDTDNIEVAYQRIRDDGPIALVILAGVEKLAANNSSDGRDGQERSGHRRQDGHRRRVLHHDERVLLCHHVKGEVVGVLDALVQAEEAQLR